MLPTFMQKLMRWFGVETKTSEELPSTSTEKTAEEDLLCVSLVELAKRLSERRKSMEQSSHMEEVALALRAIDEFIRRGVTSFSCYRTLVEGYPYSSYIYEIRDADGESFMELRNTADVYLPDMKYVVDLKFRIGDKLLILLQELAHYTYTKQRLGEVRRATAALETKLLAERSTPSDEAEAGSTDTSNDS